MKIVFVCPFDLERLTGTPIRVKTTVKALNLKHETITLAESGDEHVFGSRLITFGKSRIFSFAGSVLKVLKKERPEVIHVFTTAGIIAPLVFKFLFSFRTKIVFEMHGWAWFELGKKNIFKRFFFLVLDLLGLWFSTRVVAMSYSESRFLSRLLFSDKKIFVLWGSIDKDASYIPVSFKDNIVVGYIGNSSWWQGVSYIVEAAKIIKDINPNIHFKFAGFDYSDKEKFPQMENVTYLGKIERKDVEAFLIQSDVLVSARLKEKVSDLQFPHKLAEYVSAGRPVIVSGSSDQPLIIKEADCGIVVDPLDAHTLATAILDMTRLSKDEREKIGRRAIAFAEKHFFFSVFSQKINSLYTSLF